MEDTRPVGYDAYGPVFQQLPSKMVTSHHRRRSSCEEKSRIQDYLVELSPPPPPPPKNKSPKEVPSGNAEIWNKKFNETAIRSRSPRSNTSILQRYMSPKKDIYFSQYCKSPPPTPYSDIRVERVVDKEDTALQRDSNGSGYHINDKTLSYPRSSSSRVKATPVRGPVLHQECKECFCQGCIQNQSIDESSFREKVKIVDESRAYMKPCQLSCCYDRNVIYKQSHYGGCRDPMPPYVVSRHGYTFRGPPIERRPASKDISSYSIVEPTTPSQRQLNNAEKHSVDVFTKNTNTVDKTYKLYELNKALSTSPRYPVPNHRLAKSTRFQEEDIAPHWQKIEYNSIHNIYEERDAPPRTDEYRKDSADNIRYKTNIDKEHKLKEKTISSTDEAYAMSESKEYKKFTKITSREKHGSMSSDHEEELSVRTSKDKSPNVVIWQSDPSVSRSCPLPPRAFSTTPPDCHHKVCSNDSTKAMFDEHKQRVIGYNAQGGKFSPISHSNGLHHHPSNQSEIERRLYSQSYTSRSDDGYLIRTNGVNSYNRIRQMDISPNGERYLETNYYHNSPTMTTDEALIHSPSRIKRDEVRFHDNPMLLSNRCGNERFTAIREHHHLTPPPPKLLRVPPDRVGPPPPEMLTTVQQRMFGMFGGASRIPNEHLHPIVGGEKKRTKSKYIFYLFLNYLKLSVGDIFLVTAAKCPTFSLLMHAHCFCSNKSLKYYNMACKQSDEIM